MQRVLITGMSGTGKSTVILALAERGLTAVDTDTDDWCEWAHVTASAGPPELDWVWREDRMAQLLAAHRHSPLFVSGCKSNQGRFYDRFEHVVLLTAPLSVLLRRVTERTNNPYGKRPEDRRLIEEHVRTVEPLLRRRATIELDTSALSVADVTERLVRLVQPGARGR